MCLLGHGQNFFLFFWGEITTVHKWQLGRKAKNSLRPEEQYHTNWWSMRRFKENFGLDWVQWAILKIYKENIFMMTKSGFWYFVYTFPAGKKFYFILVRKIEVQIQKNISCINCLFFKSKNIENIYYRYVNISKIELGQNFVFPS